MRYELDDFAGDESESDSESEEDEEHEAGFDHGKESRKDDYQPGVCFPILDLLTIPLHGANRHTLKSGGKKGKGIALSLGILGNPKHKEMVAEDALSHLSVQLYVYLKETYGSWFEEVSVHPLLLSFVICFKCLHVVCDCL